jgi:hypothetical protein
MSVQYAKNYYQTVLMSEHTITDHSEYNYINQLSPIIKNSLCNPVVVEIVGGSYTVLYLLWDTWFILTLINILWFLDFELILNTSTISQNN